MEEYEPGMRLTEITAFQKDMDAINQLSGLRLGLENPDTKQKLNLPTVGLSDEKWASKTYTSSPDRIGIRVDPSVGVCDVVLYQGSSKETHLSQNRHDCRLERNDRLTETVLRLPA